MTIMKPDTTLLSVTFILWFLLVLAAPISLIWALVARRSKAATTTCLCLWCALAGSTLSSTMWASMTTANSWQLSMELSRAPSDQKAKDFEPNMMKMLVFFVVLDHFGRWRLFYAPVVVPLMWAISLYRRAPASSDDDKKEPIALGDDWTEVPWQ